MLTTQERTGVITEMGVQLLQAGLGAGALVFQWMERYGPRAKSHASFDIWARNVLHYCERYGWIEDPALLLVLLRKVAAAPRTPFDAQIPAVVARIAAQQPIVFWTKGRAWDTCHLALGLPFLNRETTRRAFEDFDNPLDFSPPGRPGARGQRPTGQWEDVRWKRRGGKCASWRSSCSGTTPSRSADVPALRPLWTGGSGSGGRDRERVGGDG